MWRGAHNVSNQSHRSVGGGFAEQFPLGNVGAMYGRMALQRRFDASMLEIVVILLAHSLRTAQGSIGRAWFWPVL